jgi:RND superfamily putative drug exporter
MYDTISGWAIRHPKRVLVFFFVLLVVMAGTGGGVINRLQGGGFDDPSSESSRALDILDERFGTGPANFVVLVTADEGTTVDDAVVADAGRELTERIAAVEGVDADDTLSYWTTGDPTLASDDATRGLVLARVEGDEDVVNDTVERVHEALADVPPGVTIGLTGQGEFFNQLSTTIQEDLAKAESIALPLTLILLIIVFAGLRAASLPLLVGIIAIFGAFGVLFALTLVTDVSIFSINLVSALGLGLAVDYSLFIVSRFREELALGRSVDDAVRMTVRHAGRAIAFSGLTVAVSLSALLIFPLYFLRSFAYAGVGVILVAMLASIVMLPALLKLFGNRLAPKSTAKSLARHRDDNIWGRVAHTVMRRPLPVALGVGAILIVAGLPFLGVKFGQPDDRVLPPGSEIRAVSDVLRTEFASTEGNAFPVVATTAASPEQIASFAAEVSTLPSVERVDSVDGRYAGGTLVAPADPSLARLTNGDLVWFNVVPAVEPVSEAAEQMVGDIRAIDSGFDTAVAGESAFLVDSKDAIFAKVPLAGLMVAATTFILLFLMFGSILVPLKAIVLNILSLTATFGLMVLVFQQGRGSGLLDFTATGLTDTSEPILMFCIAFGLSMDYEVFLLSRIKEEYDRTHDNELAVARGLARTGRIVTAAALVLSVTFFAFATSGVTFIKLFGVGLGIAVLADAFVIRATLVPAIMKLAGHANWWAPKPMAAIHRRFGIRESADDELAPSPVAPPVRIAYPGTAAISSTDRAALSALEPELVAPSVGRNGRGS